jgi:hypothetical protein
MEYNGCIYIKISQLILYILFRIYIDNSSFMLTVYDEEYNFQKFSESIFDLIWFDSIRFFSTTRSLFCFSNLRGELIKLWVGRTIFRHWRILTGRRIDMGIGSIKHINEKK